MANLIFWRHAEAEIATNAIDDVNRGLTKRGNKDAIKMAHWLNQHLPANTEILCSPALRCIQTAEALQSLGKLEMKIVKYLGVESSVNEIFQQIYNNDTSKTTLVIGHQPNLGLLIAKLLRMDETACVVKKGAVWWLRQRVARDNSSAAPQTYLFAVQHPDY